MNQATILTAFGIILLSLGVFQLLAALLGVFFWIAAGDWREFLPQIVVIAFWLNFPVTYWIWQRRFQEGVDEK